MLTRQCRHQVLKHLCRQVYVNSFGISIPQTLADNTQGQPSLEELRLLRSFSSRSVWTAIFHIGSAQKTEMQNFWTERSHQWVSTCFSHKKASILATSTYHLFFNLLITVLKSTHFFYLNIYFSSFLSNKICPILRLKAHPVIFLTHTVKLKYVNLYTT